MITTAHWLSLSRDLHGWLVYFSNVSETSNMYWTLDLNFLCTATALGIMEPYYEESCISSTIPWIQSAKVWTTGEADEGLRRYVHIILDQFLSLLQCSLFSMCIEIGIVQYHQIFISIYLYMITNSAKAVFQLGPVWL